MFDYLQIYDPLERRLVGCADVALRAGAAVARLRPRRPAPAEPRRVLLLRLERIGDLLMTLGALAAVRRRAPAAEIDLVVGGWNEALARLIPDVDRCETLDAPWLARGPAGATAGELVGRARGWRQRGYDLAINFEPDLRSNALLALSGAPRRVGFRSGGGGALLTHACDYDPRAHTAANARRLVGLALPPVEASPAPDGPDGPRLAVPEEARQRAEAILSGARRPLVGVHASGGRPVKQWEPGRFGEVAARLARLHAATIVLTGTEGDRPLVDAVKAGLPPKMSVMDLAGRLDIVDLAAVLERLDLVVTGDTGPMHLAAAVGTPLVAIFGPSDPARWGPLSRSARIVCTELWCRPCNRIRLPPDRCAGVTPDCLSGVEVDDVYRAAEDLLGA
jgi:lipopolysaccharide heptosyltransferase II